MHRKRDSLQFEDGLLVFDQPWKDFSLPYLHGNSAEEIELELWILGILRWRESIRRWEFLRDVVPLFPDGVAVGVRGRVSSEAEQ